MFVTRFAHILPEKWRQSLQAERKSPMNTENEPVLEDLIPHRSPMLLIADIIEVDGTHAITRSTVAPTWPLADDNGVSPLILVEVAAQSAGVCNGWDRIHTQGSDSNPMGWLVGIKKAEFFSGPLPIGSSLTARADNTYNFANLREIACTISRDDELIARVTLQLFQAQDDNDN